MADEVPEHEFVSPACVHRLHEECELLCPVCNNACLCICHTWRLPIVGLPVERV
jgi:hypothetical protein